MVILLSGVLPRGKRNGLDVLASVLDEGVDAGHVVVASVSLSKTTAHSGGKIVTTFQIDHIEAFPLGTLGCAEVSELLVRQQETRTGEVRLPFDDDEQ